MLSVMFQIPVRKINGVPVVFECHEFEVETPQELNALVKDFFENAKPPQYELGIMIDRVESDQEEW